MTKQKDSAKKAIRDIRRVTRRQYSAEEKIRIVLEGLRGEAGAAARKQAVPPACTRPDAALTRPKKLFKTSSYKHFLEQEAKFSRERGYLARFQLDFTTF